jgi:mono/diheme cytochrome c family protein
VLFWAIFNTVKLRIVVVLSVAFSIATLATIRAQEGGPAVQSPATSPASGTSSRSVWNGVYTEEQAERGRELYATQCIMCHGESLEGGGSVHALVGAEFAANWNGLSMGDLLDRTRTTMPMNKPGTLSRQQIADLLAFVLSVNKFPAGDAELPRQAELLAQITFLATKPSGDVPRGRP